MNVLMLSPGFPKEMQFFTRGLATVGVQVVGLGDQPESALPDNARKALSAYVQVRSFTDEADVLGRVRDIAGRVRIDRVECLWEPGMLVAARLRQDLGVPGLTVDQTVLTAKGRLHDILVGTPAAVLTPSASISS